MLKRLRVDLRRLRLIISELLVLEMYKSLDYTLSQAHFMAL